MIERLKRSKVHNGWYEQYTHKSEVLNCDMLFSVFMPASASSTDRVPVLYWLSGLTCSDENFMQKAGAFRVAAELGIAIVAPDTSPRGEGVANDEAYDLGQGAGFYVNATQPIWSDHYQMYDYVTKELPSLIEEHFAVNAAKAISGHSMGGHGALTVGIKEQGSYTSISAFSPIANPINCPWGKKAFTTYLGNSEADWKQYDSCELIADASALPPILVDQGDADNFLEEQLNTPVLIKALVDKGADHNVRMQPGYDHSYFFISTFIEEHLRFHAKHLMRA